MKLKRKIFKVLIFTLLITLTLSACKKKKDTEENKLDPNKEVFSLYFKSYEYSTAGNEFATVIADPIELNENMAIPTLPEPTKEGFAFNGWFLDSFFQTPFYHKTMPKADLELFAKWMLPSDTLFASPNGSRFAAGTSSDPLSASAATDYIKPGGTVNFLPGEYKLTKRITLSTEGNPNAITKYIGSTNDNGVTFDFSSMPEDSANVGIKFVGNYNIVKNIRVYKAGDNGMLVGSSYNTIENCVFEKNRDTGLQIARYSGGAQPTIDTWPSNNLVLNCTSFNNEDRLGENADGFAAKLTIGENNIFDGCVAYWNIDDGWDLYAKVDSGEIGNVKILNCISYENGCVRRDDGSYYTPPQGADGNGFKLGGSGVPGQVIVENSIAAYNYTHGFTDNSNPGSITIKNCTGYNNGQKGNDAGKEYDNFNLNRDGVKKNRNYYANLLSFYDDLYKESTVDDVFGSNNTRKSDEFNGSIINSILYYAVDKKDTSTPYYISGPTVLQDDDLFKESQHVSEYDYSNGIFVKNNALTELFAANGSNLHKVLRNSDNSLNLGTLWKIDVNKLASSVKDKNIGANLSKASKADYNHFVFSAIAANETADQSKLRETIDQIELAINPDIVYNDITLPKVVNSLTVSWKSSNTSIIKIEAGDAKSYARLTQKISADTKVTLTASVTLNDQTLEKKFEVTAKKFDPRIGEITNINDYTVLDTDTTPNYKEYKLYDYTNTSLLLTDGVDYKTTTTIKYIAEDGSTTNVDTVGKLIGKYEITYSFLLEGYPAIEKKATITVRDHEATISILSGKTPLGFIIDDVVDLSGEVSYNKGTLYAVLSSNAELKPTAEQIINNEDFNGKVSSTVSTNLSKLTYNVSLALNNSYTAGTSVVAFLVVVHPDNGTGLIYSPSEIKPTELIKNGTQLNNALNNKDNAKNAYKLANDIDMENAEWTQVVGSASTFQGYFDGALFTISNLKITVSLPSGVNDDGGGGLFYRVGNAIIKNISLNEVHVSAIDSSRAAVFTGLVTGSATITNIKIHNCSAISKERTAGLVGEFKGNDDGADLKINGVSITSERDDMKYFIKSVSGKYTGGVIAHIQHNASAKAHTCTVDNAYFATTLIANNQFAAGIIGRVDTRAAGTVSINHCYFNGAITNSSSYSAGILGGRQSGDISIDNCVSLPTLLGGSSSGKIVSTQVCTKLGVAPNFTYELNPAITCGKIISIIPDLTEEDEEPDPTIVYHIYDGERTYWSDFNQKKHWESLGFDMTNVWELKTTTIEISISLKVFNK